MAAHVAQTPAFARKKKLKRGLANHAISRREIFHFTSLNLGQDFPRFLKIILWMTPCMVEDSSIILATLQLNDVLEKT